jgi:MarR family transcriptional regulator, transcriptional regulator for hemolysin
VLQYDFEESVGYWLCLTAHAMQKALNEELAPHGVTYRQWQVLAWLALDGALSQAELAERMDIEPATLVSVLARMERDGWVSREDDPLDRRKRLVRPTEQVKPVWEQGIACARRVREQATRGLDPDEVEQLKVLLAKMRGNLQVETLAAEAVR